jgi:uncharacterized protein YcfL
MKKYIYNIMLIVVAMFFFGCVSQQANSSIRIDNTKKWNISYTTNFDSNPAGFMTAQFEVFNLTLKARPLDYNIQWFDNGGMKVDAAGFAWNNCTVIGGSSYPIKVTAPNKECSNLIFQAREKLGGKIVIFVDTRKVDNI